MKFIKFQLLNKIRKKIHNVIYEADTPAGQVFDISLITDSSTCLYFQIILFILIKKASV